MGTLLEVSSQAVLDDDDERLPYHSYREARVQRTTKLRAPQRVAGRTTLLWRVRCG